MASLHITEFSSLGATDQSDSLLLSSVDALVANQVVALGGTAAASNALNRATRFVHVVAGGPCSIAVGVGAVAAVNGWFLNTGAEAWLRVPPGSSYVISAIMDTP